MQTDSIEEEDEVKTRFQHFMLWMLNLVTVHVYQSQASKKIANVLTNNYSCHQWAYLSV